MRVDSERDGKAASTGAKPPTRKDGAKNSGSPPRLPEGWGIAFLKDEVTKACFLEITFPTRDGGSEAVLIGAEDRAESWKVAKELGSRNADLPETKPEQMTFVQALVATTPTTPILLTTKPGFRGPDG